MAPRDPGKPPTKRQVAAGQTRQKLLTTAVHEFSLRPYDEVTVGEIASAAGVAHGLLSHHFQGKDGIYAEAVREAHRQLREGREQTDPTLPPGERVRHRFRAHLTFVAEHRGLALNLMLATTAAGAEARQAFDATRLEGNSELIEWLGLPADDQALQLTMRSFTAAVDEMTVLWLRGGCPFDISAQAEAWVEVLAGAVRAAHRLNPSLDVRIALARLG